MIYFGCIVSFFLIKIPQEHLNSKNAIMNVLQNHCLFLTHLSSQRLKGTECKIAVYLIPNTLNVKNDVKNIYYQEKYKHYICCKVFKI